MFAVYFDESDTHDGSPVYTVAGYIATVEQWTHFEREWIDLLKELGLWPRTAFHMADIECPHHHILAHGTERKNAMLSLAP